eukprot:CAMPEP_0184328406 /NCGR_PEP_ID=MMETSP1049-20130417/143604_1 /TAXON_ID=77928 /ORGANISM="Proteomonas sulcata, Strain CCMP704" /LENGTH=220 /DNA_ID=CAMNT_0026650713 /DNA_START=243 /DNA_END=905 /DNA_ORIENTATION=+
MAPWARGGKDSFRREEGLMTIVQIPRFILIVGAGMASSIASTLTPRLVATATRSFSSPGFPTSSTRPPRDFELNQNPLPLAMSSGVGVTDDCVSAFNDLKLKHDRKYIIYTMNEKMTEIIVEENGGKDATYDEFRSKLPSDQPRYGVFDCEYTDPKTGSNRNKIVFFAWVPDNAKVRPKMIFASSKDELKKRLVGVACEVQAADAGDLEYPSVVEKILRV